MSSLVPVNPLQMVLLHWLTKASLMGEEVSSYSRG